MRSRLAMPRHAAWRRDGLDVRAPAVLIGDLESIVQQAFKDGEFGQYEIPADDLLVRAVATVCPR